MKQHPMKRRIIWRNFAKLMGIAFILVSLAMLYIYQSSMSVAKNQLLSINEQKMEMLEVGMNSTISQIDRVGAALSVDSDSFLFFAQKSPEQSDEDIWKRISGKLKTYSFGIDYIDSIILYSPKYDRIISDSEPQAVSIDYAREGIGHDIGWLEYLPQLEQNDTLICIRSVRNVYPHVLTLIKHYERVNCEGVVIINLDLRNLYAALWTDQNDSQAFVLDSNGRIILCEAKSDLYMSRENFPQLERFTLKDNETSVVVNDASIPYTYAQTYDAERGFYYVTYTNLMDYREQIAEKQLLIFVVYVACAIAVGLMILLYCTVSFQPFGKIMELLDDPDSWRENGASTTQIPEIVERIVYHLQVNEELRTALADRLDLLKTTQIQALQSQLNPHFLYNSLDAVGAMVEEMEGEDGKVCRMVNSLVDVYRYSISGQELVTTKMELDYLRKYTYILECRYGNGFTVEFDFDEDLNDAKMPRLILQPLIENAAFHGLMARTEEIGGRLQVIGRSDHYRFENSDAAEPVIRLQVIDNGHGITPEKLEELRKSMFDLENVASNHIGVQNTVKRLYLLFPGRIHVDIQSQVGKGTTISLIFPREQ